jgi:NitT/TauT family transport system permease protein
VKARAWRRALSLAVLALLWQLAATGVDSALFPSLAQTLAAFREAVLSEDQLLAYARDTALPFLAGVGEGVAASLLLAVGALTLAPFGALLEALAAVLEPAPLIALFPLAGYWLGSGSDAMELVVALAVFFPLTASLFRGLRLASPTLGLVGRNFGLSGFSLAFRILLPAALPSALEGLRRGGRAGLATLVAAELARANGGLGWFVQLQRQNGEIATALAGVLAVLALAGLFELFVGLLGALTVGWWESGR